MFYGCEANKLYYYYCYYYYIILLNVTDTDISIVSEFSVPLSKPEPTKGLNFCTNEYRRKCFFTAMR